MIRDRQIDVWNGIKIPETKIYLNTWFMADQYRKEFFLNRWCWDNIYETGVLK